MVMPLEEVRPRERLAFGGAEALTTEQLLTLVVGSGGGGASVAAAALMRRFGGLHAAGRASFREMCEVPGFGPARTAAIQAALELGRRHALAERPRGEEIRTAEDVHRRLSPILRHLGREVFVTVLLDARHHVLRDVRIAEGGLTACAIHPREVFEPAIRERAAAVVFCHNHPSGDPTPSAEDVALTTRLCLAGDALGVRAIDHVIIGDGRFASLAELGLMVAQ